VLFALSGWFAGLNRAYEVAAVLERQAESVAADSPSRERRALEAAMLKTYARSFKIANVARFVEKEIGAIHHRHDWLQAVCLGRSPDPLAPLFGPGALRCDARPLLKTRSAAHGEHRGKVAQNALLRGIANQRSRCPQRDACG